MKPLTRHRIYISICISILFFEWQTISAQCSVNAGPDLARCLNQSVALGSGLTFTGQSPVAFNWSGTINDIQNPLFSATTSMAGTHTVTITDANGCIATDQIVLTVNPLPVVNAGSDVSICPGTPTTLCAIASSANGAISNYIWMGGPLTSCRTVSPMTTPTPYSVTVADAAGCQATDAVQVTVLPAPGANAGLDQTICLGNGTFQLNGTPSGGVWTGAGVASNGLFTPTSEGATTLTYTNTGSNSCTSSDQMIITVTNPNPPSGGPDVSVCLNSPPFQLPQVGSWNGSTLVTSNGVFTPSQVGVYNLFVTSTSGGCNASDMVIVNVMALPTVNAGADQAICTGQSVNLQATASSPNGVISGIAWTGGWVSDGTILNPTSNPTSNTNYSLFVTDAAGCANNDVVHVTVNPIPTVQAGLDQSLCSNAGPTQMTGATPSGGTWSGTGVSSSGLFTPTVIGQYTVTYHYSSSSGCQSSDAKVITVIVPGTVNAGPDLTLCQGGPTVLLQSGGTWSGSPFVQANGVFNPATSGTYVLTYTASAGGCSAQDQITVTVIGLPIVNAGSDAAICANQNYSLNATANSPNGAIASIQWTGLNVSNTALLNTLVTPTASSTYEITVQDAAGCIASDQIVLTVNPLPTVQAGLDLVICSNAGASTLTGQSPTGGSWSGPQVTNAGVFTPGFDGNYTLTYVYTAPTGCSSYDTRSVNVISPLPVNAGTDMTVCEDTAPIVLASGGTWTGASYVTAGGTFNPSQPGTYNLTYTTTSNGCNITDQLAITVLPSPAAHAGADISICTGSSVNLIAAQSTTSNGSISSYAWSSGASGQIVAHTVSTNQTITLTITDAAGCVDTDQVTITALALPTVYAGQDVTLCNQPSPYSLTDFAPPGGTWSGTGVTSNGVFTPSAVGTFVLNYCVTGANGCQACDQLNMFVNAGPANNAGPDVQLCQNSGSIQLNPVISGGTWTGPGVSSSGIFTPSSFNSYTLNYTIGSGYCQVTDQIVVTINSNPIASLPATYDVCGGNSVHLNTVTTGGLPPYSYQWDEGDDDDDEQVLNNNEIANPIATPEEDITLIVDVSDARGCHATASTFLHVTAWPEAQFEMPQVACQNTPVTFDNNSSSANSFLWSFGNSETSTASNPTMDYNLPGIYQVQLTAFNALGCSHTSIQTIEITSLPSASFSMNASEGCSPLSVVLDNQSAGANLSYQWTINGSFNNTETPSNVVLTAEEVVSVQPIALTVTNQCGTDTETMHVTIHPRPMAMFATDLSSQCSPVTTQYMNLSAGNPTSYQWNLGDGQTTSAMTPETNVYVTEDESADFVIQLVAINACGSDSITSTVHVLPNTVSMSLQPSVTSGCNPLFVSFNNQTTGANNFYYDYGNSDFAVAQSPNYVFQNAGNYLVRLFADDGCSYDTTEVMITVSPSPTLVLGADAVSACPGSTLHFDEATTGNITNIQWNFGDGDQANGSSPSHQFDSPSTYLVNATAYDINGCAASAGLGITIHELPIPQINLQNTAACSPWQVCPENTSINAESYVWTSGTGSTSSDVLPCFTYVNSSDTPLLRTISLTATSEHGCTTSTEAEISVLPQPQLVMALDHNESCMTQQLVQTNVFANATDTYQWYVNDNPVSTETEPTFQFDSVGEYDIQLVVFNTLGCTNEASSLYEIHPLPMIDIMPETMNGCPPLTINFDNTTTQGTSWEWSFSNGASSNEMFPTVVFEHTGTYDVQLIATSEHGCQSASHFEDLIEVFNTPVSQFTFLPNEEVLYELNVEFMNASQGAVQYQWNFGDDTYSTLASPVHSYAGGGFYTVTLTAQNEFGCIDKHVEGIQIDNTFFTFMPNAFTPDGDGINDTFGPVFSNQDDIQSYRFYVKNKWGEIIFETDNPEQKWLGNNKNEGSYLHTDVFTWVVELAFNNKTLNKIHEGTVTLIR